jgi:hypothetical protein
LETSPIAIGHINDKVLIFAGSCKIFADTCKNNGFASKSCGIYSTTPGKINRRCGIYSTNF